MVLSEIRKYFKSRFGDGGYILEFDFSQLEVVALAQLSKDEQLIDDIKSGVDLHRESAATWLNKLPSAVTPAERKTAKMLTFQLQYGAGAGSMATKLNIPLSEAKSFIEAYYKRYPQVKQWQNTNIEDVKKARIRVKDQFTKGNNPLYKATMKTATGRRYTFKEKDNNFKPKSWGATNLPTSFSPTEIKNYPVQGFATGDVVPLMLGKVWRALKNNEEFTGKALLINTVHDSIVFDVNSYGTALQLREMVLRIMNNTNAYIKKTFGIDMVVPITADCQIGNNWMKMVDFTNHT